MAPLTLVPFTFHWKAGAVPPFTGVAVQVTDVPAHTVVAVAVIDKLTGSNGFTVMVTVLEVVGLPVVQVSLDVNTQEIVFPLVGTNE